MKITLISTISVDGFIAPNFTISSPGTKRPGTESGRKMASTTWTSKEDTQFFLKKSKESGIVVMGRSSWETIPEKYRPLKDRINIIYTRNPDAIKDSSPLPKGRSGGVLSNSPTFTTDMPPKDLISFFQKKPFNHPTIQPSAIAIIGGSSIYTQFMQAGLIDDMYLTIEPRIFGDGIKLFDKALDIKLQLEQIIDLSDQTKVLHYSVEK